MQEWGQDSSSSVRLGTEGRLSTAVRPLLRVGQEAQGVLQGPGRVRGLTALGWGQRQDFQLPSGQVGVKGKRHRVCCRGGGGSGRGVGSVRLGAEARLSTAVRPVWSLGQEAQGEVQGAESSQGRRCSRQSTPVSARFSSINPYPHTSHHFQHSPDSTPTLSP